jgi:hypothetical protein
MKLLLIGAGLLTILAVLTSCAKSRNAGELRLKHEVTISTANGERTFSSIVSLEGFQSYNLQSGGSGWGGIACRLTGKAVRVPIGERDYFFLLTTPRTFTPAYTQIGLIKKYFGLPNYTEDRSWIELWQTIAQSETSVDLSKDDYPAIAVMPRSGWMNDAREIDFDKAAQEGLRIVRYRLKITRDPVGNDPEFDVRYRPHKERYPHIEIGKEYFVEQDATG